MPTNRRFSLALEVLSGLKLGSSSTKMLRSQPVSKGPDLNRFLSEIGPLPREALFLGVAADGLPVLLNLHDPIVGPLLVIGESGAGKTAFLQSIVRSLVLTHTESEVQFGVITDRVEEWEQVGKSPHQVGVFHTGHAGAEDLLLSLASWAHSNRNTEQSVLLLVDNLEALARMDGQALQSFRWLLLRGPSRRIWPIVTMNADRYGQVLAWIEIFRTRVFGRVGNPLAARAAGGDEASALDQLAAGTEYSLRENGGWLRFNLPSF